MFRLCIKATAKLCASGHPALEGAPFLDLHRGRIRSGPGDKPGLVKQRQGLHEGSALLRVWPGAGRFSPLRPQRALENRRDKTEAGKAPGRHLEQRKPPMSAVLTAATKWLGRGRQGNRERTRPRACGWPPGGQRGPASALQSRGPRSDCPCRSLTEGHPPGW